jgi:hypothetical protein
MLMTLQSEVITPTFSRILRAAVPAIVVAMLVATALRLTDWPSGVRMGVTWFIFSMVQSILGDRATGVRRSRASWVITLVIVVVGSVVMGYLVQS